MKRVSLLCAALMLSALLSGCTILRGVARSVLKLETAQPTVQVVAETIRAETDEPTAMPTPEPTEESAAAEGAFETITSASLGIAFDVPASWAGKYRVDEGDGYLIVYFKPSEPIDDGMGKFFTILTKTSEDDAGFFDNEEEIEINGVTYLVGMPTDVTYSQENPEFDTFKAMREDLPMIRDSLRSVCQ